MLGTRELSRAQSPCFTCPYPLFSHVFSFTSPLFFRVKRHAASGDLENPGSRKLPCCVPSRARLGALAQRPNDMWDHNSYAGASPTRYLDCTYVIGALSPREQSTLGPSPFQLQSSHPHGEWNQVMAEHVECMAVMQPSTRLLYASSARTAVRSASRLEAMRLRFGVLCWRALVRCTSCQFE